MLGKLLFASARLCRDLDRPLKLSTSGLSLRYGLEVRPGDGVREVFPIEEIPLVDPMARFRF